MWKIRKNQGKDYKNYLGLLIPAKSIRKGCGPKCRNKCQEILSIEIRTEIFNFFYKLSTKERQWDYIARSVQVVDKKITKISSGCSKRNSSRIYNLNYSYQNEIYSQKVCKTMFLDTLCISNQVVETALVKTVEGSSDNRGKYYGYYLFESNWHSITRVAA